jgi:hypothetical protein
MADIASILVDGQDPSMPALRAWLQSLAGSVSLAAQGITTVASIAARDTFYATAENRDKLVYVNNNNGTAADPANGMYEYVGGARLAQSFYAGLAAVVQPLVDDAEGFRDEARGFADASALQVAKLLNAADLSLTPMQARGSIGRTAIVAGEGQIGIVGHFVLQTPVPSDGLALQAKVTLTGADSVRQLYVYILRGGTIISRVGPVAAPSATTYTVAYSGDLKAGDKVMVGAASANVDPGANNGIGLASKSGAFSTLYNFTEVPYAIGATFTASATSTDWQPLVSVEYLASPFILTKANANLANGPAVVGPDGFLPLSIIPGAAASPLATAVTTFSTPAAAAASQTGRRMLGLGNSIPFGGNHRNTSGALDYVGYRQQLRDYFGWTYTDKTVPGSAIAGWSSDEASVRSSSLALSPAPYAALVGFAENDASIALGVLSDLYPAQSTIYGFFNKMIADLRGAFPSIKIVLETARSAYPTLTTDSVHGPAQWLKFSQINEAMRNIAIAQAANGVLLLPFHDLMPKPPFAGNLLDDRLHPNNLGHQFLFEIGKQYYGGL